MTSLYTEKSAIGRLLTIFSSLFPAATRPTRHLLAWLLIAQLALESAPSVRCLFRQFLSKQTDASLNSYYRALSNGLVTDASIRQALALRALAIVPEALRQEPILLSVDDTSIAKWGKHFDGVGILYDHAKHDGKSYFNGHAFVSLTMSVPVLHENAGKQQIRYIAIPIGYVMSNGEASKLTLACHLLDEVMPILEKRQVILLFDSWYAKRELLTHALSYPNLNVICNARHDTAMFELPDSTAGRRGRPPKYGKRLMLDEIVDNLTNYLCRMDDYFVAHRLVKTRIFGDRTVHAYVTLSKSGSYRLFFSTAQLLVLVRQDLHESVPGIRQVQQVLNRSLRANFVAAKLPEHLLLVVVRLNTPTEFVELERVNRHMLGAGVAERFVLLPGNAHVQGHRISAYRDKSPQELRHALSQQIHKEVFFATLVSKAQSSINSSALLKALQALAWGDEQAA